MSIAVSEPYFFHPDKKVQKYNVKQYAHAFVQEWMEIEIGWSNTNGFTINGVGGNNYHKPAAWFKAISNSTKNKKHELISGEVYIAARFENDWKGMKIKK